MPKELLREHIRKDLMPRLMSSQDDRTTYELGLNVFEKLGSHTTSLVELHNNVEKGEKLSKHQATDISESNQDISRDLELLNQKIKESTSSDSVSHETLKLLANSVHGYACAVKATEISILSKAKEAKKNCAMPFPGSFIMLDQTITVPQKVNLAMPTADNANYLQPQNWMSEHMRRMVWCRDSFAKHGFDVDSTCDAVSAALDMPHHDELADERASLLQIETSKAQGAAAPAALAPPKLAPAVGALIQQEEQIQESVSSADQIMKQIAENARRSLEFKEQTTQISKKLTLQQKRSKLRVLKEKLVQDRARLAMM